MTDPVSFLQPLKPGFAGLAVTLMLSVQVQTYAQHGSASQRQFLQRYCAGCHNQQLKSGGLSLLQADSSTPGAQPELWEKVVRKVRTGMMPPPGVLRPSEADRLAMVTGLEASLDAAYAE